MEPPSAAGARCEEANLPGVGQGVRTAVTQKGLPEGVVSLTGKETTLGLQRPQGAGPLSASQEGRRGCGPGPILGLLLVAAGTPFPLCTRRDEAHLQLHRLYCPGLPQTQRGVRAWDSDHPQDRNTPSRDSSRTHCPMWDRSTGATLSGRKSRRAPRHTHVPRLSGCPSACTPLHPAPTAGPTSLLRTALALLDACPCPSNLVHRRRPRPASTQAHSLPGPPAKPNLLHPSFPPNSLASPGTPPSGGLFSLVMTRVPHWCGPSRPCHDLSNPLLSPHPATWGMEAFWLSN